MESADSLPRVHVIGSGLIGASIALALSKKSIDVTVDDINAEHLDVARSIGLKTPNADKSASIVFVCVPPNQAAEVLATASQDFPEATITDVTSVKNTVLTRAIEMGVDPVRLVSAHPMAGREISGPRAARSDLFEDRVWVITPSSVSDTQRVTEIERAIELLGSSWVQMDAEHHDRVVALVSHAPQILASILAGELVDQDSGDLGIAGAALGEMTRIAASDPSLWKEILLANSTEVLGVMDSVMSSMTKLRAAIASGDSLVIEEVLRRGNQGRSRVPGKHGGQHVSFESVSVMISDEPGSLAELFTAAGGLDVNLEDVRIEHVMGRPSGIVQLFVREGEAHILETGLESQGFDTRGRT
jgi:prephenate dehydrogenase